MFELRPISHEGIPKALAKADRYRLLNEPRQAESICRDVLRTDPENQEAVAMLLLSLTDQFDRPLRVSAAHAQECLPRLHDEYERTYFAGVICERWGKAQLADGAPGASVYDWIHRAMEYFDRASQMRSDDDEEALLRWNACARIIRRNDEIRPRPEQMSADDAMLQDDVPV